MRFSDEIEKRARSPRTTAKLKQRDVFVNFKSLSRDPAFSDRVVHANVDSKEKLIFTMLVCSTGRACSSETKTEGDFFFVKNPKHFGSEFVSVNLPFTRPIHGTVA